MTEYDEMLRRYIDDIRCYPRITAAKEQELASIIQNSTNEEERLKAKNELVTSNLRLVVKIAISYHKMVGSLNGVNVTVMDLIQAGNFGLMSAAERYEPNRSSKFVTYAYPSIQRHIKTVVKESRIIQIPVNYFYFLSKIKEMDDSQNPISDQELAKQLSIGVNMVKALRKHKNPIVSDELGLLMERADPNEIPLDEVLNRRELREFLIKKIDELKPIEKWIIFYRYLNNSEMTLDQLGKKFGVSKERIRMAQKNGLRHLKIKIEEEKAKNMLKIGGKNGCNKHRKRDRKLCKRTKPSVVVKSTQKKV